jgi:hypothetical protein
MNFGRENTEAKPDGAGLISAMSRDGINKGVRLADVNQYPTVRKPLTPFGAIPRMPHLLTQSTLMLHNVANDLEEYKAVQGALAGVL